MFSRDCFIRDLEVKTKLTTVGKSYITFESVPTKSLNKNAMTTGINHFMTRRLLSAVTRLTY